MTLSSGDWESVRGDQDLVPAPADTVGTIEAFDRLNAALRRLAVPREKTPSRPATKAWWRQSAEERAARRAAALTFERGVEAHNRRLDLARVLEALNLGLGLRLAYELLGDVPTAVEVVLEHFENIVVDEYLEAGGLDTRTRSSDQTGDTLTAVSLTPGALAELRRALHQTKQR